MTERALLLVNMGGPESLSEIEPFLLAIFRDPAILPVPGLLRPMLARWIARRRAPKVAERYQQIGGASPLPDWTRRLVARVSEALDDHDALIVEHAFRYTSPTLEEALGALSRRGVAQVRLLPLFPHYTDAMTGSVEGEAARHAAKLGLALETVPAFGARPEVLALWGRALSTALASVGDGARVLFIAHGIPLRNVRRGDAYPERVAETAAKLGAELPAEVSWSLAFQSRLGPVTWTGPYVEDELTRLGESAAPLILMPLSFVADCLETLYDLDRVALAQARAGGINEVVRVATFNDDPAFGEVIAKLATEPLVKEAP